VEVDTWNTSRQEPVIDETGDFCAENQKGPIWYLAGFAGSSEGRTGWLCNT
jgi:hypothetical protein